MDLFFRKKTSAQRHFGPLQLRRINRDYGPVRCWEIDASQYTYRIPVSTTRRGYRDHATVLRTKSIFVRTTGPKWRIVPEDDTVEIRTRIPNISGKSSMESRMHFVNPSSFGFYQKLRAPGLFVADYSFCRTRNNVFDSVLRVT